ncbi:MAG: hypothetical protein WDO73_05095 [Ignavibacteriota bacterium]
MKIRSLVPASGAVVMMAAAGWILPHASAQPMWDTVKVTLPYAVTVGEKTVPPGDYMIKQLESPGDSPVLLIYNGTGMRFQTSALSIKAEDLDPRSKSEVTLHHIGDNYYLDKVWVAGKNYGYQIPLPKNVREREAEASAVSVAAQTNNSSATTTDTTTTTTADNATPPAAPAEPPAPPQPAPVAEPQPQPQPATDIQPPAPPAPVNDNSADRAVQPSDNTPAPSMPRDLGRLARHVVEWRNSLRRRMDAATS